MSCIKLIKTISKIYKCSFIFVNQITSIKTFIKILDLKYPQYLFILNVSIINYFLQEFKLKYAFCFLFLSFNINTIIS